MRAILFSYPDTKGKENMAREMALAGVKPEDLVPAEKIQAPQTPQGKWENFWYHYKWHFWGGLFLAVVLGVMLYQVITKDPPDYEIVMVTELAVWDTPLEMLEQELEKVGRDIDGDGKVEVNIQNCYLTNPGTQEYYTNQQAIQSRIFAADVMLFVWEPAYYEDFIKNVVSSTSEGYQFFEPLPFEAEGIVEEGRLWNWAGSPAQKKAELVSVPKGLYFGVRSGDGTAADQVALRDQCLELLQAFATGKKIAE